MLEQLDAQEGSPVVAVTVDLVKVAQKADAVAPLALMYEAHGSLSGFVQASTAGMAAKKKKKKPRMLMAMSGPKAFERSISDWRWRDYRAGCPCPYRFSFSVAVKA